MKSTGMPFGARCEVFENSADTVADRTRPAVLLGMKSNAYRNGLFLALDSHLEKAAENPTNGLGIVNLLNKIARKVHCCRRTSGSYT